VLAVVLLVCCGVVATGAPASACPRTDTSPASLSKNADAVFTGTVADRTRQGPGIRYTVHVQRVYKGDVGEQAQLSTPRSPRTCGEPDLQQGQDYVLFVTRDGDGFRIGQNGAAVATDAKVAKVERLLGKGTSPTPPEPVQATFTMVADEPTSLTRLAAPGVALVIVGLLGLLLVVAVGRRRA
jgi:hypothetical protein